MTEKPEEFEVTKDMNNVVKGEGANAETANINFRYLIGGKLYRIVTGSQSGISWLEEVKE